MEATAGTHEVRSAHGMATEGSKGTTVVGGFLDGDTFEVVADEAVKRVAVDLMRYGLEVLSSALRRQAVVSLAKAQHDPAYVELVIDLPDGTQYVVRGPAQASLYPRRAAPNLDTLTETAATKIRGVRPEPVNGADAPASRACASLAEGTGEGQKKLLVVEDDYRVMPWVETSLASLGYDWVHVTNQADALASLGQQAFDCVLLDTTIPAQSKAGGATPHNGSNLLRRIRQSRGDRLPVVVMATKGEEEVELLVDFQRAGATELIAKPFSDYGRTLVVVLREVIEAAEVEAADAGATVSLDEDASGWLNGTQAAELLMEVVSSLTIKKARARVSAAANRGEFVTNGKQRTDRRIERDSFNTWRFKQRDRDLAAADEGW